MTFRNTMPLRPFAIGFCVACWTIAIATCHVAYAPAQAVDGDVSADDPPPPLTYHGLIPGLSSAANVRDALGEPQFEAKWYAWKMIYPAADRDGLTDIVHTRGREGKFACVEAASVPAGFTTREQIHERLGPPEYTLRMPTFQVFDYAEQGVRFVTDPSGKTIGVAYFPHLRPRVHAGARKLVDLSHLRTGPQPEVASPASCEGLLCGAAARKVTPKVEWLNPRVREHVTVHDDLWARCAVFERGDLTVAIVGIDLFGMSLTGVAPIQAQLREDGVETLVFGMSHNHAAPDTIGVYGHYPAEYVEAIGREVVAVVREAKSNMVPVKQLRTASRELPMDGARVIGYFRNARNPGIVDPTFSILQAIADDGKPITTLVNFACHVEGIEAGVREMTADFPGYMCDAMAAAGMGQAIFLNGAVGGMVSGDNRARTHDEAKVMGEGLARIAHDLAGEAQPPATFQFTSDTRRLEIPMTNPRFKPLFEQMRPLNRGRVVTEMTLVTLGECQLLTLPGELLPEVSFEILEHMQGFPRMLVGLANDQLGYLIPAYDFRDDEYEESMSPGPAAAPILTETALRMLSSSGSD